jgi:hypothetical protein
MSSVGSSFAQKSGRTTFFLGLADVSGGTVSASAAFSLATTTVLPKSTVSQDQLNLGTGAGGIGATIATVLNNTLYKDLGREIVVFDDDIAGHPVTEVFRQVYVVNGRDTGGVPSPLTATNLLFVKVFSSVGSGVHVARTG